MKQATKKKTSTAPLSGRVTKKKKTAVSAKTSTDRTPKKAKQKIKGVGTKNKKSTNAEQGPRTPVGKSTNTEQGPRTPVRKKTRTSSAHSTPSTMTLHSTSSSKRAVTMMSDLQKTKNKKMKSVQDEASGIDFSDASTIDWLSEKGLCDALECYGEDQSELESFDLHEKVVRLCSFFKPNDIRPVFQGICQEAGKNWRSLKIAKHKSMKKLASEFANSCVDIVNARTDCTVPGNITIKKENQHGPANA